MKIVNAYKGMAQSLSAFDFKCQKKAPNSKLQIPEKHQMPNSKHGPLELGISLEHGTWILEFSFRFVVDLMLAI